MVKYIYMCVYIEGSQAEIQIPTHWNLIGSSMNALPPVLSPSNILPPPLSHCAFIPARKNSAPFKNSIISMFFLLSKICISLKLRDLKLLSCYFCTTRFNTKKFYLPSTKYIYVLCTVLIGHALMQLVEARRYKPEDRGFASRWGHWNLLLT
jgi:hypothetical protein